MSGIERSASTHPSATSDEQGCSLTTPSPSPCTVPRHAAECNRRRGGTSLEYCLAAALIGVVVIPGVAQLGAAAVTSFGTAGTALESGAEASSASASGKEKGKAGKKKGGKGKAKGKAKGGKGKGGKGKGGKGKGGKGKGGKGKGGKGKGGKGKGKSK